LSALPPSQLYIRITIPGSVSRITLGAEELPGWGDYPYGPSQEYGDDWYDRRASAVLIVPSVVSPFEPNVLLNQRHKEFVRITTTDPEPAVLDQRLFAPSSRA
jgi:RES domain-containing protein